MFRPLVVIPTYNEYENLTPIVRRLHAAVPAAHVLIVDDGSPDGTGELADGLAARDNRVQVLHRPVKSGLGGAYLAGFDWALQRHYDAVVEMDADGSHAPEELPRLLTELERADLVLGSRWVPGGAVHDWPLSRRILSRAGNTYARVALGVRLKDVTGGYRAYRAGTLLALDLDSVRSQGYCFQIDLAWRAAQAGFVLAEVPITFRERRQGESKMDSSVVFEAFGRVTRWGLRHRVRQLLRTAAAGPEPVRDRPAQRDRAA